MTSSIVKAGSAGPLMQRAAPSADDVVRAFFARRSPHTVAAYRSDLRLFAAWVGFEGEADLNALTTWLFAQGPGTLNALLMQWLDEQTKAGLAPFTANRRLSAVKSLVKLGQTLGVINWSLSVQGVRGAKGVRDMRGPMPGDVLKLFAAAKTPYELALLHLLYTRGLRSVECRELRVKHVELQRSEVLIRGKGKTGLTPVTVPAEALAALQQLIRPMTTEDFVFSVRDARVPPSHSAIWRTVKRVGARAKVAVRPHGLRHSAITAVLDATNGDVRRTQKFSRHADPGVLLKHYDDARQDFGGELSKLLSKNLKGGK